MSWIEWYCSQRENRFFAVVDEEYARDDFNLTGISEKVPHYNKALDLILSEDEASSTDYSADTLDSGEEGDEGARGAGSGSGAGGGDGGDGRFPPRTATALSLNRRSNRRHEEVCNSAALLFGLIHARYILSARGLAAMVKKYQYKTFGVCPNNSCLDTPVLPLGLSDQPKVYNTLVTCPSCRELYWPANRRLAAIDGAYFGTTFANLFALQYSDLFRQRSPLDFYIPRIFGYKLHNTACLNDTADRGDRGERSAKPETSTTVNNVNRAA